MFKRKTHSGAKKRFKLTKSGRVKASHAKLRHLLTKKSRKNKRSLRKAFYIDATNSKRIASVL